MKETNNFNFKYGVDVSDAEIEREVLYMANSMKGLKWEESFHTRWATGNTCIIGFKYANSNEFEIVVSKDYTNITYDLELN